MLELIAPLAVILGTIMLSVKVTGLLPIIVETFNLLNVPVAPITCPLELMSPEDVMFAFVVIKDPLKCMSVVPCPNLK